MEHIVSAEEAGLWVKEILKSKFGFSSTLIKKVKYGGITVNGEAVTVRRILAEGDLLRIEMPIEQSENIRPAQMPIDVLYEDEDILAVNKAPGIPTHPSRGNHIPSLAEGVMAYYEGQPFVFRAVNRLDRETSGIVLIAKNELSAFKLSEAMKRGEFRKEYLAVLESVPEPPCGTVDMPILRPSEDSLRRIADQNGKPARTDYEVLRKDPSGHTLVRLRLHSGRTHQIRVHMAYLGHPLLYDFLYGTEVPEKRFLLHATLLSFPHPRTKERIEIRCPAPFEMQTDF